MSYGMQAALWILAGLGLGAALRPLINRIDRRERQR